MQRSSLLRALAFCGALGAATVSLRAQESSPAPKPHADLSSWQHVQNLPAKTHVHVSADHGGGTCRIFSVTEETLTCAKGEAAGTAYPRAAIKQIKLTHYGRSTLVGAGVGGGIGALSGGIATRTKPCPTGQNFCLNGLGGGAALGAAVFGVGGAVLGSIVGGVTDFTRGSSIYVRP